MNKRAPDSLRRSSGVGRAQQTYHAGERTMLQKRVFKRFSPKYVQKQIHHGLERGHKLLQLHRTPHPGMEKRPVFVVGCNRSGTNMVCGAIGKSPHGWDYRESAFSLAFNGYYLRADWVIESLIRHTPAPIISFGGILDSQFTGDLLTRFQGARATWVYRRYEDVANSCARMQWADQLKDFARWVAQGEPERLGARGEHISADTIRLFGELFHEDLSKEDSACLYWYLRNQLYFDLNLHLDSRVLIIQYEDTVQNQEIAFRRVFDFLGFPFDIEIIDGIFASSVGKHRVPNISPAIQALCDDLQAQLDTYYARTSDWIPENRAYLPTDSHEISNNRASY